MQPRFPRSYFELQLDFGRRVAARFVLPLDEALRSYTTFAVTLRAEDDPTWERFAHELAAADDPLELTYQRYLERRGEEEIPQPESTSFMGHPLFGCFYYVLRDTATIRTHFLNNDLPGMRPLSSARADARRTELRRMFTHIRTHHPEATTVQGHSWLYNIEAYTRLFPPSYTAATVLSPDGVLNQLVLWFQCYDREWGIKPDMAAELLRRVDAIDDPADLRLCFPYQRLRTEAPIADFYTFYGLERS